MNRLLGWIQQWVVIITIGFLFGGDFLRTLIQYSNDPNEGTALLLLVVWLAVLITEPLISRKWRTYFPLYLILQSILIFLLLYIFEDADYYAILFAGLSMQVMDRMPPKAAIIIIAFFTPIIIVGVSPYYDIAETIPLVVIYTGANAFLGASAYSVRKAREERENENQLIVDLQDANSKLAESAKQAEQLSIACERSRMALELHDSVTQTIFSMTLSTRAAIILLGQDASRVGSQLDHLDQLVRSALEELKKLVIELKPDASINEGLIKCLQKHVALLNKENLKVTIQVIGEENLRPGEVQSLFRIAQESLNNVIKHSQTSEAWVILDYTPPVSMEIRDKGRGFELMDNHPGVGLVGMKERVAEIGWSLEVESKPGKGTRILVWKNKQEKGDSNERS
jgi:signal transduction histidine kinase